MGFGTNREYLLGQQYHDSSRLSARARLHALFGINKYGWFPFLFDHLLALPAHARILELGSGPGWLWSTNIDRIPAGWDVTLSDFSQGMVAEAEQRLGAVRPFTFAVVDAQNIPYDAATFDGVIADHMLYHVPDRPRAFAEIRRVLKPGGRFYASTMGVGHLSELWALFPERPRDPQRSFPFNLQNGAEALAPFFDHVELHRYDDGFVATEAGPLVDYILSLSPRAAAMGEGDEWREVREAYQAALTRRIQGRITADGPLRITSDMSFFECW